MQQDKQGTAMNKKFIPETLTISGRLAMVFLKIIHEAQHTVFGFKGVREFLIILPNQQYECNL